ncbi:MAG: PEP-CTERM sorting domain-containing protein [Aetokthonos hydrillicola CCALA 1050]|nr:PEP-CTERM sorting domain-containing protein [Aetokthonos hydrillicola CCALA 1050]MBW4591001.1 PEP-CTERM sorting domain-containing protein [Aetokthonos hydrillicola CCALA 1050]
MSKANAASISFSATGTNNYDQKIHNDLGASVVFDDSLNPGKLTVSLTNNQSVSLPSDILTAVFWDYNGSALNLSLSSATAPQVTTLDTKTTTNQVNLLNVNSSTTDPVKEWAFAYKGAGLNRGTGDSAVNQHYGLSTAGLNIFSFPKTGQQMNYGIIGGYNSDANPTVQGGTFINNSATFVLSGLPTNFDIQKIGNIRFQYGTDLKEPSTSPQKVPESSTAKAVGLFALIGLGLKKKVAVALH